jgi:hypothetical protein
MNDDELIMALREQRGTVTMTTPVEQIIRRGRAVRARRRIPAVAATMGVATVGAATAVAVAMAPPTSHLVASRPGDSNPNASHPASSPSVQLAAWTVTRRADGSIQVTIRQAFDPVGLQRALRADGVPASVTFSAKENPACRAYHFSGKPSVDPILKVAPIDVREPPQDVMVIYPAALPSGVGLRIEVYPASRSEVYPVRGKPTWSTVYEVGWGLVYASPQCTGS